MGADVVDGRDRRGAKRDRLARLLRVLRVLEAHSDGLRPEEVARRVESRAGRPTATSRRSRSSRGPDLVGGRSLGRRGAGVPPEPPPDDPGGDGRLPLRPPHGHVRGQVRPGPRERVHEARRGAPGGDPRPHRADRRHPEPAAVRRRLHPAGPPPLPGLGREPRRDGRRTTRARGTRRGRRGSPACTRGSSSRRRTATRSTSSGGTRSGRRRGPSRSSGCATSRSRRSGSTRPTTARRSGPWSGRGGSSPTRGTSRWWCGSGRPGRPARPRGRLAPDAADRGPAGRLRRLARDGLRHARGPPLDPRVGPGRRGPRPGGPARGRGADAARRGGGLPRRAVRAAVATSVDVP